MRTWKPSQRWGVVLLALAAPAALAGLSTGAPVLLAVGVVSFFVGLWCFAIALLDA